MAMKPDRPAVDGVVHHVYVHIPFCHRVCPYCSFYKHTPGATDIGAFIRALFAELDYQRARIPLLPHTLYFGGGTPSMLSPSHTAALLDGLRERLDLSQLEEWTIEANPRTFDTAKARRWREAGVTRVSLGVQSWNPRHLATLGRDHSPEQADEAFACLREAGIPMINIDHMFALPGQSLAEWQDDLDRTLALAPEHIATYNLTYEEDTEFMKRFERGEFTQDADEDAGFFQLSHDKLSAAGYAHYETSNFASISPRDCRSRHNRAYWIGNDYLGIGPGAVSTVHGERWTSLADTARYTECALRFGLAATEHESISDDAWLTERIALELRTSDGLRRNLLEDRALALAADLAGDGLLEITPTHVRLTDRGRLVADAVAVALL